MGVAREALWQLWLALGLKPSPAGMRALSAHWPEMAPLPWPSDARHLLERQHSGGYEHRLKHQKRMTFKSLLHCLLHPGQAVGALQSLGFPDL